MCGYCFLLASITEGHISSRLFSRLKAACDDEVFCKRVRAREREIIDFNTKHLEKKLVGFEPELEGFIESILRG